MDFEGPDRIEETHTELVMEDDVVSRRQRQLIWDRDGQSEARSGGEVTRALDVSVSLNLDALGRETRTDVSWEGEDRITTTHEASGARQVELWRQGLVLSRERFDVHGRGN